MEFNCCRFGLFKVQGSCLAMRTVEAALRLYVATEQ